MKDYLLLGYQHFTVLGFLIVIIFISNSQKKKLRYVMGGYMLVWAAISILAPLLSPENAIEPLPAATYNSIWKVVISWLFFSLPRVGLWLEKIFPEHSEIWKRFNDRDENKKGP